MATYADAAQRRRWIRHYETHGRNAAATARHFGIARSTLLRWLARYDPAHPRASLSRQRSGRRARVAPKLAMFFGAVIDLNLRYPRWGARRIRAALLAKRDDAPSEGTIGRWLAQIRHRCPVCKVRDGHDGMLHALDRDIAAFELVGPVRPRRARPKRSRHVAAVAEAEAIVRRAAWRGGDV